MIVAIRRHCRQLNGYPIADIAGRESLVFSRARDRVEGAKVIARGRETGLAVWKGQQNRKEWRVSASKEIETSSEKDRKGDAAIVVKPREFTATDPWMRFVRLYYSCRMPVMQESATTLPDTNYYRILLPSPTLGCHLLMTMDTAHSLANLVGIIQCQGINRSPSAPPAPIPS